jgi:Osmosensitive K+ channel His kinase sensor domain
MNSGTRPGYQDRPDLIEQARMHDAFESQAGWGKLRTYLGIPPRVGKTHAMLRDGRGRRRSGVDTVIAHWERPARRGPRLCSTISRCLLRGRSPTGTRALRIWTSRRFCTAARGWLWWMSCWPISNRWARSSPGSPGCGRPSRYRMSSCGPGRSRWSTWRWVLPAARSTSARWRTGLTHRHSTGMEGPQWA